MLTFVYYFCVLVTIIWATKVGYKICERIKYRGRLNPRDLRVLYALYTHEKLSGLRLACLQTSTSARHIPSWHAFSGWAWSVTTGKTKPET